MSSLPSESLQSLPLQLVFDEQDRKTCPWMDDLDQAIRMNPDSKQGVFSRKGWVYSERGPASGERSPEFLVCVSQAIEGHAWYGHVFQLGVDLWIAILVQTSVEPDGETAEDTLRYWRRNVVLGNDWEPGYRQGDDDIASHHETFAEAMKALIQKIRLFRRDLRDGVVDYYEEYFDGIQIPMMKEPPDSVLCLRGFEAYGFLDRLCGELLGEDEPS